MLLNNLIFNLLILKIHRIIIFNYYYLIIIIIIKFIHNDLRFFNLVIVILLPVLDLLILLILLFRLLLIFFFLRSILSNKLIGFSLFNLFLILLRSFDLKMMDLDLFDFISLLTT